MLVLCHWKSFPSLQVLLQKCKGIIKWVEAVFSWKGKLFKKFRKVSIRCRERRRFGVFAVCISIPVCCWGSLPWICTWDQLYVAVICGCPFTQEYFSLKFLLKNKIIFSLFSLEFHFISLVCVCVKRQKGFPCRAGQCRSLWLLIFLSGFILKLNGCCGLGLRSLNIYASLTWKKVWHGRWHCCISANCISKKSNNRFTIRSYYFPLLNVLILAYAPLILSPRFISFLSKAWCEILRIQGTKLTRKNGWKCWNVIFTGNKILQQVLLFSCYFVFVVLFSFF